MNPALVVKLRPNGPWRSGPDSGARNRVDPIYHSDSLYAAVTAAMARLGLLEEWLSATALNPEGPAVRFSSCFPFLEDIGFVVPPRTIWPPPAVMAGTTRVRWKGARFIPLGVVSALFAGQVLDEDHWTVDGVSECLLPAGQVGPFRTSTRWAAAVDRFSGASERHATACLEFRAGAGLWAVVGFADEERQARWAGPVRGALRLLADSGLGGERSRGWGRSEDPEFIDGTLPEMILAPPAPPPPAPAANGGEGGGDSPAPEEAPAAAVQAPPQPAGTAHWLLSLFTPGPRDEVDWSRGSYGMVARGGRVESPVAYGDLKRELRMVTEGSVLVAGESLCGSAPDVAPEGFAHPVFRAGYAVSIPIPAQVIA